MKGTKPQERRLRTGGSAPQPESSQTPDATPLPPNRTIPERARETTDPERTFRMIPGIGPGLARTLHETLHVETLEALEAAAAAGRLQEVRGFGRRRITTLRIALAELLARVRVRAGGS